MPLRLTLTRVALPWVIFALTLGVFLNLDAHAQGSGPFARMAGHWAGSGTIDLVDGGREPLKCRASYDVLQQNEAELNIRCASESYNFDLRASVTYSGGSISGTWSESTRMAGGTLSGRGGGDHFSVLATGPSFSANLTLVTHGNRQSVVIKAHDTSAGVKGATINLQRGG